MQFRAPPLIIPRFYVLKKHFFIIVKAAAPCGLYLKNCILYILLYKISENLKKKLDLKVLILKRAYGYINTCFTEYFPCILPNSGPSDLSLTFWDLHATVRGSNLIKYNGLSIFQPQCFKFSGTLVILYIGRLAIPFPLNCPSGLWTLLNATGWRRKCLWRLEILRKIRCGFSFSTGKLRKPLRRRSRDPDFVANLLPYQLIFLDFRFYIF